MFILSGCGEDAKVVPKTDNSPLPKKIVKNSKDKILVVYFSVPETTNPKNMNVDEENSTVVIDGKVLGNTQYLAQVIQKHSGADIFRIEPETPYPMNHAELEQIATKEKQTYARPAIAEKIRKFSDYKIFFVGYPNWYGDMPNILYTFFEEYSFSGKIIIPFVTSGSKGFSNTISKIEELQPNANVIENGLSVSRNDVHNSEKYVQNWLKDLGLMKD